MPDALTFGRYAEIPYDRMTPEQQDGYPRAIRRSTAARLSDSDLARAARSSCAFSAFAAALRRSAKLVFLDLFISVF
jgi:hypothetical protein